MQRPMRFLPVAIAVLSLTCSVTGQAPDVPPPPALPDRIIVPPPPPHPLYPSDPPPPVLVEEPAFSWNAPRGFFASAEASLGFPHFSCFSDFPTANLDVTVVPEFTLGYR